MPEGLGAVLWRVDEIQLLCRFLKGACFYRPVLRARGLHGDVIFFKFFFFGGGPINQCGGPLLPGVARDAIHSAREKLSELVYLPSEKDKSMRHTLVRLSGSV